MATNAKASSPPPKPGLGLEDLGRAQLELYAQHVAQLDKWLQRLADLVPAISTYEMTITSATEVAAGTTSEQPFTVTGLTTQDIVYVNKPSHQSGLGIVGCRVSAADTLAITYMATATAPVTPANETYFVVAIRR